MSAQQDNDDYSQQQPSQGDPILRPAFSGSVMVAAIVILIIVIFLILLLHLYAKWFWRHSARLALPGRSRRIPASIASPAAGLDAAAIAQLPTFTYAAPASAAADPLLECAVCLSDFQENEKGRLLPACKHAFHTECIDMWFFSHSTCPLCRTVVLPDRQLQPDAENPPNAEENLASPANPPPSSPPTIDSLPEAASAQPRSRALPQITINIPQIDAAVVLTITTPRRPPLSASACIQEEDQAACSSPQTVIRSPGLGTSLKRILSRKSSRTQGLNNEGSRSPL